MEELKKKISALQSRIKKLEEKNAKLEKMLSRKVEIIADEKVTPILQQYYDKGYRDGAASKSKKTL